MKKLLLTTAAALGLAVSAQAATTVLPATPAAARGDVGGQFVLFDGGSVETRDYNDDSSAGWNNASIRSTAYLFELTNITDTITDADFTTYFRKVSDNITANIDNTDLSLFATISNSVTLSSSYQIDPANFTGDISGTVNWTSIQLDFIDGANRPSESDTSPAAVSLSSAGKTEMVSFLDDYYTNTGFSSGDYLVVGLAMDLNGETPSPTGSDDFKYDVYPTSAGNSGTSSLGTVSALTITTIPEPSTFALLAGALGLAFVMLRRRR